MAQSGRLKKWSLMGFESVCLMSFGCYCDFLNVCFGGFYLDFIGV